MVWGSEYYGAPNFILMNYALKFSYYIYLYTYPYLMIKYYVCVYIAYAAE